MKVCANPNCKKEFVSPINNLLTKRFCSRKCAHFIHERIKRKLSLDLKQKRICDNPLCRKKYESRVGQGKTGSRYCSAKCCGFIASRRQKNIPLDKPIIRGRTRINKGGYRIIYMPKHKNCFKDGSILEHRYVMSEFLGRPLLKTEIVHHKNGVRTDNRIQNLELKNNSHCEGQDIQDKIRWAKEILSIYCPKKSKIVKIPKGEEQLLLLA